MIRVENLSKRFGETRAVDDISFEVRQGEIYGLLGPNGAGKTTTLSMLAGLLRPDVGRILFEGVDLSSDPVGVRRKLGVVPQEVALYADLTARENLRFWAGLYGLKGKDLDGAVASALDRVGLTARANSPVKTFSGGMKRRLNLSLGLAHAPAIVLMDEPTVGIDPQARENILDVVRDIAASGTTILYTTHYLEEAETLCDRIGIMDHGKVLAEGTLDELNRMIGEGEVVTVSGSFGADDARKQIEGLESVRIIIAEDGKLVLSAEGDASGAVSLLSHVLGGPLEIEGVSVQHPSLNSLFLKLTGRELRD